MQHEPCTHVLTLKSKNSVTIFVLPLMEIAELEADVEAEEVAAVLTLVRGRVACIVCGWVSNGLLL